MVGGKIKDKSIEFHKSKKKMKIKNLITDGKCQTIS